MTDAWSSLIQAILWVSLWVSITIYFSFKFKETLSILPKILKKRLKKGAPFTIGPVSIGTPPEAIKRGEKGGVTSEGTGGISTSEELELLLTNSNYPDGISDKFFLVHSWDVLKPSSNSAEREYRIRLWLESSNDQSLDLINRVTYKLPQNFPKQIIATEARGRNFELWLNTSSELNVLAHVEKKDKGVVWLNRHLTLPGRPHPLPLTFLIDAEVLDALESKPVVISDDANWTIQVKWEIPALDRNFTGYWDIGLAFTSIIGDTVKLLKDVAILKSTLEPRIYTKDIRIAAGFLPIGLYYMEAFASFMTEDNTPGPMGGIMHESKLIYCHKMTPFDLKHPFEIPVRANFLSTNRKETNHILVDEPWIIHVEWNTLKRKEMIWGHWEIEVFLQSLTVPSQIVKLPNNAFVVNVKLESSIYEEDIHMEPKSVYPHQYKVVVIVKNVGEEGLPTNLVGVFDGPLVQFDDVE